MDMAWMSMSAFYFNYMKSEPRWKSVFMEGFLSAAFTHKDVALAFDLSPE